MSYATPWRTHRFGWWSTAARLLFYSGLLTIALLAIRPVFKLTLSDWLFFASILAALPAIATADLPFRPLPPVLALYGLTAFAAGAFVSSLASPNTAESLASLARIVYLVVVWLWLSAVLLRTPGQVRTAMWCWVGSVGISGLAAVIQLVFGDVVPNASITYGRMSGLAQHVNDLGGSCAIAAVPALALATSERGLRRLICTALFSAVLVGLILSGSVGSLISAGVGLAIWLLIQRLSLSQLLVVALGGLVLYFSVPAAVAAGASGPTERLMRVFGPSNDPASSFFTRSEINDQALASIAKDPFIGVGFDTDSVYAAAGNLVHNMYLGSWMSGGLLALIGLCIVIGHTIWLGIRRARAVPSPENALPVALVCSAASFLVFALTEPVLYDRFCWAPLALLAATGWQAAKPALNRTLAINVAGP